MNNKTTECRECGGRGYRKEPSFYGLNCPSCQGTGHCICSCHMQDRTACSMKSCEENCTLDCKSCTGKQETMEERLEEFTGHSSEKKFYDCVAHGESMYCCMDKDHEMYRKVIAFIKKEIAIAVQQERERIEKAIRSKENEFEARPRDWNQITGFHIACNRIINLINKQDEQQSNIA